MTEYTDFRIVDTESTGPSSTPNDVVCELASVDYNSVSKQLMGLRTELVNCVHPMPPDAQGVHHISDAMLKGARDITQVIKSVLTPYPYPEKIVFVAHNAEYEFGTCNDPAGKLLKDYLDRNVPIICTYKAALRLWPDAPNHKNQTLRYYLKLEIPAKLDGGLPHRAGPDTVVTALILIEALKLATPEQLIQWTKEPRLMPTCPIGQGQGWRGKKWPEVDPDRDGKPGGGFLRWMTQQADMDADLKWNAQRELDRRHNERHSDGRAAYMSVIPRVIDMAATLYDLRQWFADEKASRESLGIMDGTDDFTKIVDLCKARADKLPKSVAPVETAPAPAVEPALPSSRLSEDAYDTEISDETTPPDYLPPADDDERMAS